MRVENIRIAESCRVTLQLGAGIGFDPELLTATGGGILCQPDDPASLAKALESLLAHPDQAQALADHGRQAVRQRFGIDAMTQRVLRVYELAAESGGRKQEVRRQK